uniref:ARAD1C15400p n=1 Tax=Blastobotrys adeninivorans TaxID=409370 RepID=A0A060T0C2_BLAAD
MQATPTPADKVLKRAQIAKMTRNLKSRLQLASFKTKRGWQNLTLETIEPRILQELQQKQRLTANLKRKETANGTTNDTNGAKEKLSRPSVTTHVTSPPALTPSKRVRHNVTSSSPQYTSPQTPRTRDLQSSPPDPPRTPSPQSERGADLLMYLATSPSPAPKKIHHTPGATPVRTPQVNFQDYLITTADNRVCPLGWGLRLLPAAIRSFSAGSPATCASVTDSLAPIFKSDRDPCAAQECNDSSKDTAYKSNPSKS